MPFADIGNVRMHYAIDGPPDGPALLLSNSLGTSLDMWTSQIPVWSLNRRVIRYDTRGHGKSNTPQGAYTIKDLAQDAINLLDHLGIQEADLCGLSMGGMICMSLAATHPERIRKLVIANSAPRIGTHDGWNQRIESLKTFGLAEISKQVRSRWFTERFLSTNELAVSKVEAMFLMSDPEGYLRCCVAIRDADLWKEIQNISVPTLIISGSADPVIPESDQLLTANAIREARRLSLDAAHLSNVEQPTQFAEAVERFLRGAQ